MDYRLQRSVSTISRTLERGNDVTTAVTVTDAAASLFFVNSGGTIGIKGSSTPSMS